MQYPQNITNRIQYTYGDADATDNRVGRVTLVQDASGGTEFFYGKLGETTKIVRTLMLSTADVRTYVSEVKYDSWNRIRQMKYPDGETVTYGYDGAGQLKTMISEKDGNTYRLIDDMRYNLYGNVTYKKYGNGTESRYIYDPLRQRLTSLSVQSAQGNILDAAYSYDKIDNILGITNRANPSGELGGTYSHSYSYDAFSRLTQASGECSKGVNYTLAMQYDVMSNPLRKTQNVAGSTLAQSTDFTYLYTNQQPNAVKQIGNTSYSYDLNGNPILVEGDSVYREMIWNEENRLMLLSDDGEVTRYTYDYAGNCAIKSHGPMTSVYINGALQGVDYHDDSDYTLYVSPFMTVNADRFTKYYYAGTQRIAGKIGNGKFDNIYGEDGFHLTAGQKDYAQRAVNMLEGLQNYYKQSGVTPGIPNQLGKTADPYVSGTAYPNVALGNYDVPDGWPGKVVKHGKGEVPGPPVWFEEESVQEAVAGVGYQSDNQEEKENFFYHTDHLQSTTYLTDSVGNISQFVWYAPYGEALIDEHVGSYENPYKFSGKELDENTGLYDHGARHRDPASGVWYGVDALFEKYPEISPYSYCGGNPVRFVDMDGKEVTVQGPDGETVVRSISRSIVGKELNVSINGNGKLAAEKKQKRLSKMAKPLYDAITSEFVKVNLLTTKSKVDENGMVFVGGGFKGCEIENSPNGNVAITKQIINMEVLDRLSEANAKPGQDIIHEITESYISGVLSLSAKENLPDIANENGLIYQMADQMATPQSGYITPHYYDSNNMEVSEIKGVKWAEFVSNGKIIMTYP